MTDQRATDWRVSGDAEPWGRRVPEKSGLPSRGAELL